MPKESLSSGNLAHIFSNKQKPCPVCGKPMHRQSKMCRGCYVAKHSKPESYLLRHCPTCGKSFIVHKTQVDRGQGKYCSRSCARSGSPTRKKQSPMVKCQTCVKRFNKYQAEVRKSKGNHHFCSPECWYAYNQRDNHYLWTGGQNDRMNPDGLRWRKAVLRRDKHHCRVCHATKHLEVHHIYPFGKYPEKRWKVDNGLTLCHDCHVKIANKEMNHVEMLSFIASVPLVMWRI